MLNAYKTPTFMGNSSGSGPLAPQHTVTRNAALAEGKIAIPHRFYLVDGRIIDGYLYRGINSRLVDELYGQKGSFVSVLDAECITTGEMIPYMAINERHIVSIQELADLVALRAARREQEVLAAKEAARQSAARQSEEEAR